MSSIEILLKFRQYKPFRRRNEQRKRTDKFFILENGWVEYYAYSFSVARLASTDLTIARILYVIATTSIAYTSCYYSFVLRRRIFLEENMLCSPETT